MGSSAPNFLSGWNPQGQLDIDSYTLKETESDFLKGWTKIGDDEELKRHVIAVQAEAWEVRGFLNVWEL